jgi:hypothetical protein
MAFTLCRSVLNSGLDGKVKTGGAIENALGPPTLAKEPQHHSAGQKETHPASKNAGAKLR